MSSTATRAEDKVLVQFEVTPEELLLVFLRGGDSEDVGPAVGDADLGDADSFPCFDQVMNEHENVCTEHWS